MASAPWGGNANTQHYWPHTSPMTFFFCSYRKYSESTKVYSLLHKRMILLKMSSQTSYCRMMILVKTSSFVYQTVSWLVCNKNNHEMIHNKKMFRSHTLHQPILTKNHVEHKCIGTFLVMLFNRRWWEYMLQSQWLTVTPHTFLHLFLLLTHWLSILQSEFRYGGSKNIWLCLQSSEKGRGWSSDVFSDRKSNWNFKAGYSLVQPSYQLHNCVRLEN